MVAIVTGEQRGLSLSSLSDLGQRGITGNAAGGRNGELAYVNAATGNLVLQDRDDYLASVGVAVGVVRTYNSQGQFADGGNDWIFGVAQCRLQIDGTIGAAGSSITRTGPDGAQSIFVFDAASGAYVNSDGAGANDKIRYDAGTNHLILTNGTSNVSESYESSGLGRVLSTTDPVGNKVVYSYDSQNRLASIVDASGESIAFGYDGSGNVTSISTKLKDGTVVDAVSYTYDSQNRLTGTSVTLNPANGSGAAAQVYTTTYTYDGSSERIASVSQSDGTTQSFTYVQVGTDYRVATFTSGDGHVTRFDYDTVNQRTTVTDALGLKSSYSYDAQGRLTQLSGPAVDGAAQTTTFSYGTGGHVTQITDASGHVVTMQYDANGNQVMQQDASGNTITRTFNASNRLLTETVYLTPANGATAAQQPLTSRNVYDDQGLLRFTISPAGRVSEYRYDATGERTSIIQYGGSSGYPLDALSPTDVPTLAQMQSWQAKADMTLSSRVDMTYDLRGLLASQITYSSVDAQGNGIQDGTQAKTQYVHDQAGRLLTTIDAHGNTTQRLYDGLGRVLSATDALGRTTLTRYDDAHNKTVVQLASGLTTISAYDHDGLLISAVQTDAAAHQLGQTTYTYDADDRLRMTQDPTGVRHYLLYDDAGRKVADIDAMGALTETRYDQNDAVTQTIAYATPLSASNLAALLDANGNPANVTLASIRPASSPTDHVTRNLYDASGRLAITIDAAGQVTQTIYDGASRVISVIRYATAVSLAGLGDNPTIAAATPASSADDRITRNFYDDDGLLRGTLDGEGYLVEYRYDAAGRETERIAYAKQTDASLRASANLASLVPAADPADIHSYTLYNSRGQITGQIDGEGFLTESIYDSAGNLTRSIRYATAVSVRTGATVASLRPASSSADQVVSYTYTALNQRATSVDAEGTTTVYRYDSVGNLISATRAAGTADQRTLTSRYDLQGRLTGELSAQGAAQLKDGLTSDQINAIWMRYGTSYAYDAAGRRVSATDPNGNTTLFYYDQDGRMTHTVNALGEVQERQYDALGQLTSTVEYGARIAVTGLTGGLENATLTNALDAVRNAARDSRTSITYTATGLMATTTDALGNVSTNTYDIFRDVTWITNRRGMPKREVFTYDHRGLRIGVRLWATSITTSTQYDAFGRVIRSVDANGNVRTQSYDRLGRVIQTVDPLNAQRSTTYDAFSRVLSTTDASGTTTYTYDTAGRSVTVTSPGGVSVTTVHTRNGQTASIKDGLGNVTSFTYDTDGNLIQTDTPLTHTVSQYDAADRLIQTTDANGKTVSYSYDAANRVLQQRVDPNGLNLTTSYQYDAKGQRITTIDPNGTVTQISYDAMGQQVSQTVDPGGLNLVTRYSYEPRGKMVSVTGPTGTVTQYGYDRLDRRIEEHVDASGLNLTTHTTYDSNGNAVSVTDPDGNITRYVYDANDRPVFAIGPMGNVTQTVYDQAGHVAQTTTYSTPINLSGLSSTPASADVLALLVVNAATDITQMRRYDADGHLTWTVDGTGGVVHYEYDANGNVTKRTVYANRLNADEIAALRKSGGTPAPVADSAHDQVTRTVYDALGRAVYMMDATGTVAEQHFDGNGNLLERIVYATPMAAEQFTTAQNIAANLKAVSAHDQVTRTVYDALGRAVYMMDATGAVVEQHFDGNGNLLERIGYANAMAPEQFTTLQNIATNLKSVADPAHDAHVVNQYDAADRLRYTANAAGAVSQFVYDNNNNLISRTDYAACLQGPLTADSNLSSVVAGASDRTTQYAYDAANRRIATLDAAGALTAQIYDAAGNVTKLVEYGFVDASVKTAADAYAKYIGSVNWDATSGAAHCVTVNSYDAARRLIQKVTRSGATASATIKYDYDAAGNVTKITDPLGGTTTQTFDACGRKISTSVLLTAATATTPAQYAVTTTQYDAFGNAVAVTDPLGHTGYFYFDQNNRVVLQVDPLGFATQTTYAPSGKPGQVTRYATAVTGNLSASTPPTLTASAGDATTTFEYDRDGRLTKSTDAEGNVESFAYDGLGDRVSHTGKTGGVTVSTYDSRGLLLSETLPITSTDSTGAQKSVVNTYSYDAFGNRTQMIEAAGLPEQRTTTYAYDADNRLITQTGDAIAIEDAQGLRTVSPTQRWTYDAAGNKTSWTDANGNVKRWAYDAANRKIAELGAVGTLSTWTYDVSGNVISSQVYDDAVAPNNDGTIPTPAAGAACRQTTYTYDAGNRQIGTQIAGVAYGERPPGGTNYDYYVAATITTSRQYDALGNVIAQTDGRGNTTRWYYNALGQKIAQVDANNDLTVWTLDQNGNTTEEREYANRLSIVVTAATAVGDLIANAGSNASDRITDSTYDHLGRLLTQSKLALQSATIDGNGGLIQTTGAATTRYVYDGLGNVIEKTEANGDVTDWTFDAMGRQIEKKGAAFTDFQGALVRPTTDTVYDGLGDVTATIARGKVGADDRVTRYTHNAAGFLIGQFTQGVAGSYQYKTDAVGNTTETIVLGTDANGNPTLDSTVIGYDAANREVSRQARSAKNGDPAQGWINSVTHNIRYNAHGEVTGKGINGSYTEFAQYDSAGRLWKTNSGNGATKVYLYDKNGNATMLIESAGADLTGMTLDQIMQTSLTQGASTDPVVVAAIAAGGIHMTASIYDANNRLTDTYQPTMQSAQSMGVVQRFLTQQAGTNYTVGQVLVGPTAADAAQSSALPDPSVRGGVAISGTGQALSWSLSFTYNWAPHSWSENLNQVRVTAGTMNVSLPLGLRYGTGNLHVVMTGSDYGSQVHGPYPWNQTNFSWSYLDWDTTSIQVFQDLPGGGQRLIAAARAISMQPPQLQEGGQLHATLSGSGVVPPLLQLQGQSPSTYRIMAMRRPAGSNGAWTPFTVSPTTTDQGAAVAGWFSTDWSAWGAGRWDLQYFMFDANGTVLNAESGTIDTTNPTWPSISQNPLPIGGVGQSFVSTDGYLHIIGQPSSAQSLTVSYRQLPSGAWATAVLGVYPTGCFQFPLTGLSGDYEYRIANYSGPNRTGSVLSEARGTFNTGGPVSALTSLTNIPENVTFNNQPANSATMDLTYSVNGGPATTVTLGWNAARQQFNWDASALAPDPMTSYFVTYSFKVKDSNGAIVNAGSNGQLRLGFNAGEVAAYTPDQRPPTVTFSPPNVPNATQMVLQYRTAGSTGPYTPVTLVKDANGNFVWNVSALRPAAGALNLEYAYTLLDANGNKVVGSNGLSIDEGTLTINADGSSNTWRLAWTVTGLNNSSTGNPQAAIHRSQAYDAFGDIVSETDGRGNTTTLAYDTNGHLIRKTAPQTHATQEDGTVISVTPTTNYYYGASGLLLGVQDANGNLNTQTRLAGFGTSGNAGDSSYATTQFEAGGGRKTTGYDIFGEAVTQRDELGRLTTNTFDNAGRLIKVTRPGGDTDSYTYDTQGERISHTNALNRRETTDYDAEGRVIDTVTFGGQKTSYTYSYDATIAGAGGRVAGGWVKVTSVDNADGTVARSASDTTNYFGQLTAHTDYGGHSFSYGYNYAAELIKQTSSSGQNITYDYYANGYLQDVVDHALNVRSEYEYDNEGNRTRETYESADTNNRVYYQMADVTYDELNRVAEVDSPGVKINYEYDANGNRRRVLSSYTDINGAPQVQDYWYKYDSQNRFVLTMGAKGMGLGTNGVAITYDAAGERIGAAYADGHTESYSYNADGYLTDVSISKDGKDADKVLRAHRAYDALGRVTEYVEYADDGKTFTKDETSVFDDDNRMTKDTQVLSPAGQQSHTVTITYDYRLNDGHGNYTGADQGVVTHTQQHDTAGPAVVDTATGYVWWDQAEQSTIQVRGTDTTNPNAWRWGTGLSDFRYDVNGHLQQVLAHGTDYQGRLVTDTRTDHVITYTNDAHGQVLQRDDLGVGGALAVTERYYYLDGNRIGDVTNDGPSAVSYAEELAQADRQRGWGHYRYGYPVTSADFDQNYEPISAEYPGKTPFRYTVQDGDTLNSIARALWGDASLWYVIADANGLTSDSHLSAGQILSIPNKVANFHNNASTFKVYNPGEAIGDAMPTLPTEPLPPPPPAPSGGGCGGIGMIIAVVVAVVATIYTAGAAAELMGAELAGGAGVGGAAGAAAAAGAASGFGSLGVAALTGGVTGGVFGGATGAFAAAIGGAVGAIASQGVLIATGNQHGFQWSGVALGAIGASAGAEIGQYASTISGGSAFARGAAQAAASSTISQGLGVATGLQQHFDWRGIAASAIMGGVGSEVGQTRIGKVPVLGNVVGGLASQTAGAVVLGGSMQDRLPEMIGSIAGNTIGDEIGQQLQSQSTGMSALYGARGNVDDLVAQSGYAPDPGKLFAWSANSRLDPNNGFDMTAASLGLTPRQADAGMERGSGASVGGSPYSPNVNGYAMTYPAIAASGLPEPMGSIGLPTVVAASGVEAGGGDSMYLPGPDGIVHLPTIAVRPSSTESSPENVDLMDEGVQRVAGTILGVAQMVGGAAQLLSDQGWVVGNALTGGWLAHHNSYASDAVVRESALGQSLARAPGYLMSLVSGAGDVTPSSAFNDVFHLDEIQRLNAAHDFVNAQALLTQGAVGAASLAVGGAGAVSDALESGGLAARTFGQSGTGQYLAARMDELDANPLFATQSFIAPPNMKVWTSVDGVAGGGTGSTSIESAAAGAIRSLDQLVPGGRIPSVRNGAFTDWYNQLTPDEFGAVWSNPEYRDAIQARIRQPGGLHEWLPVSQTDTFKSWGVSMEDIKAMRTPIGDIQGANPEWVHGGDGSTTAHNEIIDLVNSSSSFAEYKAKLQVWADTRLVGGSGALPEGLRN